MKNQAQQAVNYVKGLGERKESMWSPSFSKDILHLNLSGTEENGMDIIVTGTIGRTGIDRLLSGGVAGSVVRN